ncbi:MAG: hypothetical protein IJR85_02315 [Synergistaceae bacterium]|nr:hypothetical protein [Synergistaceae bacterium]
MTLKSSKHATPPPRHRRPKLRLNVEVNFNDKLYKNSFVPDLEQVKNVILIKQKDLAARTTALQCTTSRRGSG